MPFAALDLHKKVVEAIVVDDAGAVVYRDRFPATRTALEDFARHHLSRETAVALEATTNTWAVVEILRPYAGAIVPSNPLKTRLIAEARIKTDRIDAAVLVHLLRTGFLPGVWVPDAETQALRHRTTERANLSSDRTRLKNRIHAVLHQRLIDAPPGDLFDPVNLRWLASLDLDPRGRTALLRHLRQLAHIEAEIELLTDEMAACAYNDPRIKLLMSLPGVDFTVASALIATLGEVDRFPSADHAAAYFGLVPSTYQSAERCVHGPITKQGRGHARWLLVQAAQHIDDHPGPLGVMFRRIAKKKNRNVAVVATARKLVTIAWHMLRNNEPYRYAKPSTTQAKFARLRLRVTGAKRKGGLPKGQGRPASYGSGRQTRGVPPLDQIYESENLPALAPQAAGEIEMLSRYGLTEYAESLRKAHRIPKKTAQPARSK